MPAEARMWRILYPDDDGDSVDGLGSALGDLVT